jgi:cell division protein FtsI (penicillin-binding protein 3)
MKMQSGRTQSRTSRLLSEQKVVKRTIPSRNTVQRFKVSTADTARVSSCSSSQTPVRQTMIIRKCSAAALMLSRGVSKIFISKVGRVLGSFKYIRPVPARIPYYPPAEHLPVKSSSNSNYPAVREARSSAITQILAFFTAVLTVLCITASASTRCAGYALTLLMSVLRSSALFLKCGLLYASLCILTPFAYILKTVSGLVLSWMCIHGEHGVPQLQTRKLRMCMLMGVFSICATGICVRLFSLQGIEHTKWEEIASKQHKIKHEVSGARGIITDRNGVELAVSIPSLAVGVHPTWVKDKETVSQKLAAVLSLSEKEVLNTLQSEKPYVILARGIPQSREKELRALKLYGLELEKDFLRLYPQGDMASTIIGRIGREGYGLSGIERSFEPVLKAPSVERALKRDARGRVMNAGIWDNRDVRLDTVSSKGDFFDEVRSMITPRAGILTDEVRKEGGSITLTVDSAIQGILEDEIDRARQSAKASQVFGVVMDAHSGEILAMGQTHRFNPNEADKVTSEALRNVVLQNSYEPGSTFKPIVAAIALDQGFAHYDEQINCENGHYRVGKHTIRDVHPVPTVGFEQIIVRSSNIGMVKLGFRMGKNRLHDALRDFGFGDRTHIGLDGESRGIFRDVSKWATVDVATHSFGQGISVTALQMMQAYGAIANGGMLIAPRIIQEFEGAPEARRVLQESTSVKIRQALKLVTEDTHGTGKNSRIPGVSVFGKTGTAQKARKSGKGYDPERVIASFIGFVDGHTVGVPRTLVAYIAVDEPGVTPRWGGTLAAPVFRNVLERSLSYLLSQDPGSRPQMARSIKKDVPSVSTQGFIKG